MKPFRLLLSTVLLAFSLSAAQPARDHLVVLISVDGLASYFHDDPQAKMPTIRRLAAEGARAERMRASPGQTTPRSSPASRPGSTAC
jgi:predicted AlkP superfamily pyrophosphatase or phosphodiesterase